ncbi:PadR family transcriptional regulator [Candidatus Woesearchaeota archaeon]|nr:PadR family transcriptional regulator [Candidatus Woesearchaeota archaeon]
MEEIKVTNLVKFYTLLLLKRRPMHGYELIKELERCMTKNISASHVYPFLKTLQKNMLIALKESGKRKKKQYKLTKEGEKLAHKLINRFTEMVEISINPRIRACAHCGCKIASGGHRERIKNVLLTFCCSRCAASYRKK